MGLSNGFCSISPMLSNNVKVLALDSTLQKCLVNFRELLSDYEQLQIECETNKMQLLTLKNKCNSKNCSGSEELKKVVANKDQIIQSVASSLSKLSDTKNWDILAETFKIIFEDATHEEITAFKTSPVKPMSLPELNVLRAQSTPLPSPRKENSIEEVSFKEESLCEIQGTPTGRTSPIIHPKKNKGFLGKSSDFRDKKKCSDEWPTSESKSIKLTYRTPSGKATRLRQSRLDVVRSKPTSVVDLTCSPEFSGGSRSEDPVLPLIKKESIENDDTILPSPTSGPTSFNTLKNKSKVSPKFKKPCLSLKVKSEKCENEPQHDENSNVQKDVSKTGMEDSINILNPLANRFIDIKKEKTAIKTENPTEISKPVAMDEDATHCEIDSSISLLDHVNKTEQNHRSPAKRPLAENINIMNTPPKNPESSISILQSHNKITAVENVKRKFPDPVEPVYKEPTVRNKQEKHNLQGWSCEQCKNFYGEIYKDDPVMLAKKINECSKHRGKHNPERPKTPPNFWNPRWNVPEDTEEFNRLNNAN